MYMFNFYTDSADIHIKMCVCGFRSCPSQIVLVVWRGLPELRSGCEASLRPPAHNTVSLHLLVRTGSSALMF